MDNHPERNRTGVPTFAMNPRAEKRAVRLAEGFFEHEKAARVGRSPEPVDLATAFFPNGVDRVWVLSGLPFHDHELPAADQHAVAVRVVTQCTVASAVACVRGVWVVNRCAACGHSLPFPKDGSCTRCGARLVPKGENPYRQRELHCDLQLWGWEELRFWTARAECDARGSITGWVDDYLGKRMPLVCDPWRGWAWMLEPWIAPHFALSYPLIRQFLEHQPGTTSLPAPREITTQAVRESRLLRVDPARLEKVLRTVNVSTLRRYQARVVRVLWDACECPEDDPHDAVTPPEAAE